MNVLLWILQVALALLCISGGVFQMFKLDQLKEGVAAMRALPASLWVALGAVGCAGGVGLILPGATNALLIVTPIAAAVVAAQSALISALYLRYRDTAPLPYSAAMAVMGVFIVYGRLALAPL